VTTSSLDLYRQVFPPAWGALRSILDHETVMLSDGRSVAERRVFLQRMGERAIEDASAVVDGFLKPLTQSGFTMQKAMVESFESTETLSGRPQTIRHLRNAQRRLGLPEIGIDHFTLICAVEIHQHNVEFAKAYASLFDDFVSWIDQHPDAERYERRYQEIQQQRLLPSERDLRVIELLLPLLPEMIDQIENATYDAETAAYVRGVILDTPLHQILQKGHELGLFHEAMVAPGLRDQLIQTFIEIISHGINERLAGLGPEPPATVQTHASDASNEPPSQLPRDLTGYPELMTIEEVADYLRISESKVHELMKSGALTRKKVGGKTRIPRLGVAKYLGMPKLLR